MNKEKVKNVMSNNGKWSSKFGFIMASAGSAIGLGNLWKFPYVASKSGGGLFLIVYIILALAIGVPVLLAELAVGRNGGKNAVDSCKVINPKWGFAGGFGAVCSVLVLSFYSVVGGWVIKYFLSCAFSGIPEQGFFEDYSARSAEPILWQLIFILICSAVVVMGISGGIEKASAVLLPVLLVFLIGIMIYIFTLPNASEGIKFFLLPDLSGDTPFSQILLSAMGQMFFSLSLGMGTLITYGSYLSKDSRLVSSTFTIVILDTIIAVIAGLVMIPAVFSFGMAPDAGPGMIFSTLPAVFSQMKGGRAIGAIMFFLILIAAVTSAISLIEVVASFFMDRLKIKRVYAVLMTAGITAALGIPASLSFGELSGISIFGMNIFDFISFAADNIIMPLGAIFICILVGRVWGVDNAADEISNGGSLRFRGKKLWGFILNYAAPAVIIAVSVFRR